MSIFYNFDYELYKLNHKIYYPNWYKAEKYYNCEDGWKILKNFLRK